MYPAPPLSPPSPQPLGRYQLFKHNPFPPPLREAVSKGKLAVGLLSGGVNTCCLQVPV